MSFSRSPARPAAPRDLALPILRTAILILIAHLFLAWPAPAQKPATQKAAAAQTAAKAAPKAPQEGTPRLVVVLVIDQFRADYLDRFRSEFGAGGFARLLHEGAVFRSCYYPYAITETGPGHATLATGTTPDRHGIASNNWYDAEPKRKRVVYALEDESSPVVGTTTDLKPVSPRNLIGTTLSDEMRLATQGRTRAFGVALKDRAAILSTGHGASGAYWYDLKAGGFITSKYYRETLPDWVLAFNQKHPLTVPGGEFARSNDANNLTVEFAEALIEKEDLDRGEVTNFLFVGFSANDYAGHAWGPNSLGVKTLTIQTDGTIAALLGYLDRRVGRGNYWLALSADHGVAPTLAQARDKDLARLDAKNIDSKAVSATIEAALAARWGEGPWLIPDADLQLNRDTLRTKNVRLEDATRVAGEAAITVPGILGYVTPWEAHASEQTARAYRLSYFPGRSPDLHLVPEPFALEDGEKGGTSHGTPYTYDTLVPLILFGPEFAPGDYYEPVSPADLAPTLAAALKVQPPALATGRVLAEAFRRVRPGAPAESRATQGKGAPK